MVDNSAVNADNVRSSSRGRVSRVIFAVLAWVFVASVVVQTLLAGMAIFNDPIHWNKHVVFVRIFEFIPFVMLIFAFVGRMPASMKWMSFALYGMIFAQYATANAPGVGALHPVMALGLIVLSLHVAKRGTRSVREKM
jgi:mercuric ion transport protein